MRKPAIACVAVALVSLALWLQLALASGSTPREIMELGLAHSSTAGSSLSVYLDMIYSLDPGHSIQYLPHGPRAILGTGLFTADVDLETGGFVKPFCVRPSDSAVVSLDGSKLLTSSFSRYDTSDAWTRLWDTSDGRLLRGFSGRSAAQPFSADGSKLVIIDGSDVILYDSASGKVLGRFGYGWERGTNAALSADGDLLLICNRCWSDVDGSSVTLWDTASGNRLRIIWYGMDSVPAIAISPTGDMLLIATHGFGRDATRLYSSDGALLYSLPGAGGFYDDGPRFSPSGDLFLRPYGEGVEIRETATGDLICTVDTRAPAAFSADESRILTIGSSAMREWDAQTGELLRTLRSGENARVTSVAISPNGGRVLTSMNSELLSAGANIARLWDTQSGIAQRAFWGHAEAVTSVAFSPDGTKLLTGSDDKTARLWRVGGGQPLRTFTGHGGGITSVAFSSRGSDVLTGSVDRTARLWDAETAELIRTFQGHTDQVSSVAVSPDGALLLTGSWDGTACLWQISDGRLLRTLQPHYGQVRAVAFSPDGTKALTASTDFKARLWSVADAKLLRTFQGHTQQVVAVAFSPDGGRIITGSLDNTARVCDVDSGDELATVKGHAGTVSAVVFSPDGRHVITGSHDGTSRLWRLASPRPPTATPTVTVAGPTATATRTATRTPTATEPSGIPLQRTFQNGVGGYTLGQDVEITSWYPNENQDPAEGGTMQIRAKDQMAALIQFDVSVIPPEAMVTSATLQVFATSIYASGATVGAYRVNRAWSSSQATWQSATSQAPWTGPGCNGVPSDRTGWPESELAMRAINTWYQFDVTDMASEWVSDQAVSHGLVLKTFGDLGGTWIASNEHGGADVHPKLTLHYHLPGVPTLTATSTRTRTATSTTTATSTETSVPSATATPTATTTATPSATGTATETPSPTDTATLEPTASRTPSPTEMPSSTPTATPSATALPSTTSTPTATATKPWSIWLPLVA